MKGALMVGIASIVASELCLATDPLSDQTVNSLLRGCGGGQDSKSESTYQEATKIWSGEVEGKGRAEARTIAAILDEIVDDKTQLEAYKIYAGCFERNLSRYFEFQERQHVNEALCQRAEDELTGLRVEQQTLINDIDITVGNTQQKLRNLYRKNERRIHAIELEKAKNDC